MEKLDALLVRIRPLLQFSPDPVQDEQLGLLYMATFAEQHGFRVRVLDEPNATLEFILNAVRRTQAPVVGFFCDHENVKAVFRAAGAIKKACPAIKLIAGGPQASAAPWDQRILEQAPFDVVVRGEGEETFLALLRHYVAKSGRLADIPGLVYRVFGESRETDPRTPTHDLDTYPIPDRELNLFGRSRTGSENIITSRGCPFHCTFCYEGRRIKVRRRSVQNILDEIEILLRDRDMHYLALLDDVFTMSAKHVLAVCDGIKRLQDKYRPFYWFCEGRADILCKHPEMLTAMQQSGLIRLQIGVETGNQAVLDAYDKSLTLDEIRECVALCYDADILSVVGNFIIGGAHESWETLADSIGFANELMEIAPGCYDFNTTIYTPYPGTPMYSRPRDFGMQMLDPDCVTGPGDNYAFCATDSMSKWEILDARHVFMEAVETKAASLLPLVSEQRRIRHFEAYYLIRMHTIWVQIMSRSRNLFNYYGLQISGQKCALEKTEPEAINDYKPIRTINIGASHDNSLVVKVNNKTIKFSKIGEKIFEYCYGKLSVGEICERIASEFDGSVPGGDANVYVKGTLAELDREKLVVFSSL